MEPEYLPKLDPSMISTLASKIKKNTQAKKALSKAQATTGKNNDNDKKGRGREKKSTRASDSRSRGAKRDARGNVKQSSGQSQIETDRGRNNSNAKDAQAMLLQEIIALGGSKTDLELITDAISEDGSIELQVPEQNIDGALDEELKQFAAGLGLETMLHEHVVASESEGEMEGGVESELQDKVLGPLKHTVVSRDKTKVDRAASSKIESGKRPQLIFTPRPDWHAAPMPLLPSSGMNERISYHQAINNLRDYALTLFEADSELYASNNLASSSSHRFLSTIMASGTLSDKVSALTLVVQESPLHTKKALENILTLARKRSRGQAIAALGALKDLFGAGSVLPTDRWLRQFTSQPGLLNTLGSQSITKWTTEQVLPAGITKEHLVYWAYEDWLKDYYFELLKVLETWCNDEVEYARTQAVTYVYELLKEKPEQESNLLRLLVNKLGDPEKKIASRASYLLLQLQVLHPLMKPIIVKDIHSEILLRPGQSAHAKYYAINTLNQTVLSGKEEDLARRLLNFYFNSLAYILKHREPVEIPIMKAVNKKGEVQGGGSNIGKMARAKEAKDQQAKQTNEELTEKMISAVLTGVNRAFPFSGNETAMLEEHMNTLFKITHSSNFNTSIQALMIIEQLATTKYLEVDRFYRTLYESLLDPRLITTSKHTLYLNLLFRAIRSDLNLTRVKAFIKRLLQILGLHQPDFVCGALYMIKELEKTFPGLRSMYTDSESLDTLEHEIFHDADKVNNAATQQANAVGGEITIHEAATCPYDGRKRDPLHSQAGTSCLWEIIPFLAHYHPSTVLFASTLRDNMGTPPKPDLETHTLIHFLDRFVYRNAKATKDGPRGSSVMQPLSGSNNNGVLLNSKASRTREPVNSEGFWRKKLEEVNVEDVFFHKYFNQIGKAQSSTNRKSSKSSRPNGLKGIDDKDEDEVWQALVHSRPEVEGGNEEDSNFDMTDSDIIATDAEQSDVDIGSDIGEDLDGLESDLTDSSEQLDKQEKQKQQLKNHHPGSRNNKHRRMLKDLPVFAAVDEYAKMIDDNFDEDSGHH